jgi:hypothetical protein
MRKVGKVRERKVKGRKIGNGERWERWEGER